MSQEKPIDILVRNIWGSWDGLRAATESLMKVSQKNNGDVDSKQFKNELVGNIQMSPDEYRLAMQAIRIALDQVKKSESKEINSGKEEIKGGTSERDQSVVTGAMIRDAQIMEEQEERRVHGTKKVTLKEVDGGSEEGLERTHPHFKIR